MRSARKRLLIVGAGGFGREVLWTAHDAAAERDAWDITGFLDHDVDGARRELAEKGVALPVVSSICDYQPRDGEVVVCALAEPREKLAACEMLRARGAEFASVIHPTALVHPSAEVGVGLVLRHYTGISPNARVGDFVTINFLAGTAHDTVVGDGCTCGPHSDIMGGAVVGRGVLIGSHAAVLPGARVGDFATVGAGSVVLRRVAPGVTVFGVPAKKLDFVPTVKEFTQ